MINEKFLNALKKISTKLNDSKVNWMLAGSTNLALQGVEIRVLQTY